MICKVASHLPPVYLSFFIAYHSLLACCIPATGALHCLSDTPSTCYSWRFCPSLCPYLEPSTPESTTSPDLTPCWPFLRSKLFLPLFLFISDFSKNWSIADLQCWVNYWYTAKQFSYTHIHTFIFFSIMVYHKIWRWSSALYSRTLLLIHSIYKWLRLLTPAS